MTPNLWTLPETVHFADTDWRVHTDFRDVLEILRCPIKFRDSWFSPKCI